MVFIISGISLPGSLDVSLTSLLDLSDNGIDETINVYLGEANRPFDINTISTEFYIEVEYDINGKISLETNSSGENLDDAWGMGLIEINSIDGNVVATKGLPTVDNFSLYAGAIHFDLEQGKNINLTGANMYSAFLDLTLNNQGILTADVRLVGNNNNETTVSTSEQTSLAQKVWIALDGIQHPISNTMADQLEDSVNIDDLKNSYQSNLDLIKDEFNNKNIIESFSMVIPEVPKTSDSLISRIANSKGKNTKDVFDEGELVFLETPFDYNLKITDFNGSEITIVNGNVYGVIKQKAT